VGQLLNSAWNLTDTCRFKLVPNSTGGGSQSGVTLEQLHGRSRDASSGANNVAGGAGPSCGSASKSNHHKETADRLDMPPPPSPASSTCSDTPSSTSSMKRQKRPAPKGEDAEKKDEEEWPLKVSELPGGLVWYFVRLLDEDLCLARSLSKMKSDKISCVFVDRT